MKAVRRAIVALAALVASLGLSAESDAQTKYTLAIDCYGYGGIEHTGTNDVLAIRFFDASHRLLKYTTGQNDSNGNPIIGWDSWEQAIPDGGCTPGFFDHATAITDAFYGKRIDFFNLEAVKFIQIGISGKDAFWIDQLDLEWHVPQRGYVHGHWGVNEGDGYCLSNDPKDANGAWKKFVSSRGCQPCFEFQVDGNKVVNCPMPQEHFH